MDIVYISELEIKTIIGVYDWEREVRQVVKLDLEMGCDIQKAANSDNIEHTLDYHQIADRITAFVEQSKFQLVETMAENIASIVLKEFNVSWLKLRLGKPKAVSNSKEVGVIIERGCKK